MKIKNLATHIPERLTVYEFLTELNEEQLSDLEEMIAEVRGMRKDIACEWGDCQGKSEIFVDFEGETYAFCSDKCKDEFWDSIKDSF